MSNSLIFVKKCRPQLILDNQTKTANGQSTKNVHPVLWQIQTVVTDSKHNYSKTGFWSSYCQISTDPMDNILHTPIAVLVGRLRPRSARGRLQAKPKRLCFCNTYPITHPKSYIETTHRRGFGGKPSKWRWGRVLSWKILEFCSVGGARSKNCIFRVLGCP